jgi:hypothetical protein
MLPSFSLPPLQCCLDTRIYSLKVYVEAGVDVLRVRSIGGRPWPLPTYPIVGRGQRCNRNRLTFLPRDQAALEDIQNVVRARRTMNSP